VLKAIIFDLDDTLYDYQFLHNEAINALEKYVGERYGVAPEQFRSAWRIAREETKQAQGNTAASHNRMLYCQKTLEKLKLLPAYGALEMYEVYWGYILAHMSLREGAAELLTECRNRGLKIGICSDLTAHIQHCKLKALGISAYIDCLVTSEEVGVEKPDQRVFQLILKKLACAPDDVLYIGDSLERDVYGAEACGISVLWFLGKNRDNAVANFGEVRKWLQWT